MNFENVACLINFETTVGSKEEFVRAMLLGERVEMKANDDGFVDKTLQEVPEGGKIYMDKGRFKNMSKNYTRAKPFDSKKADAQPVVEGDMGSTKQIGEFDAGSNGRHPVYSHGKGADEVFIFKDSKPADPAPAPAPAAQGDLDGWCYVKPYCGGRK